MLTQPNQDSDALASSHLLFQLTTGRRIEIATTSEQLQVLCILALDNEVEVRLSLLDNSNIPTKILAILAEDEHPDVRFAVAEDYRSPQSVLEFLRSDENPYVANRAERTVKRLSLAVAA